MHNSLHHYHTEVERLIHFGSLRQDWGYWESKDETDAGIIIIIDLPHKMS